MKRYIYIVIIIVISSIVVSCDSFLDVMPDNRTMLDSPQKIKDLLVTSYPRVNYSLICELSADNFIDNRSENTTLKVDAFERMDTEIFEWSDVASSTEEDSPYFIWEQYYQSIAVANQVIEAIEKLKEEGNQTDMSPQKGEALILRAYSHFMLVNLFSKPYKDANLSKNDLGITYMLHPEKQVLASYVRNSVAEVYELIAKDIEEGVKLIDDNSYQIPKYHFTENATYAFASQFYLYKRDYTKVIEYANKVLGTSDPGTHLRNWQGTYSNPETELNVYISVESPANLLLIPTHSVYARRFTNTRYGVNGSALEGTINGAGPTWSGKPSFLAGWVWSYGEVYGLFIPKTDELFEYTDKVARIGYAHVVRTEFTTDDVLLNRAEAKIMTNDVTGAISDLQAWNSSHKNTTILTKALINSFYTEGKADFSYQFHTTELSPSFVVTSEQKPLIDCVLHFRRLERILEGHRWFDLKRYGIDIKKNIGREKKEVILTYDDDRRALQIPMDVIGAGLQPNPRAITTQNNSLKLTLVY